MRLEIFRYHLSMLQVSQENLMSRIAYAMKIFFFLGSAIPAISGCAEVNVNSPAHEVKAFFVAGNEAVYQGLQCPSSGYVDLSAYSHLMGVKYPPTSQVDVLRQPPSRPYKSFAMLEYEPAPHGNHEAMVEDLKNKAREIGANAIILCSAGSDPKISGITPTARMQAVAIRYILTRTSDKKDNS
jgi:hypothetical protein